MTAGSWDVIEGVIDRWVAKGLDDQFVALWDDATLSSRYSPLCDGALEEGTPRPACVFEQDDTQTITMMSSDTAASVRAIANVQMQFRIHARSKSEAVDLAKMVADAFDNASFAAGVACVIGMRRVAEFGARDGSEGWMWVLRYVLIHDADQALSN
jgi:hypothetical protein